MKKIYFIFNLQAGRQPIKVVKTALGGALAEIIDKFTKAGYEITVRPTQSKGDAIESTIYACENNFDYVVCAGGDGTLNECITGMMQAKKQRPIGYIPIGTTNDFSKGLGIPNKPLLACDWIIKGLERDNLVACDIGSLDNKYFTYVAAFGALTNVTYETPQILKNSLGHLAYLLNGATKLTSIKSRHIRVELSTQTIEDDFVFLMVTNSKEVAGLFPCNNFMLDDGVFELTMIKMPSNLLQLQDVVTSLLNGKRNPDKEYIKHFKTNKVVVTALDNEPINWNTDGENGGENISVVIQNNHQAVTFIIGPEGEINFTEPLSLKLLALKEGGEQASNPEV